MNINEGLMHVRDLVDKIETQEGPILKHGYKYLVDNPRALEVVKLPEALRVIAQHANHYVDDGK